MWGSYSTLLTVRRWDRLSEGSRRREAPRAALFNFAQGASPAPVPVPPTLALPSRRPSPKRLYARRSLCGHRRRLCSHPPLTHSPWLACMRRDHFAQRARRRARRTRRTTSAAPTTPDRFLPAAPAPHTPSHTLSHNSLPPFHPSPPSQLPPSPLGASRDPTPLHPRTTLPGRASGLGWCSSFFVFDIK